MVVKHHVETIQVTHGDRVVLTKLGCSDISQPALQLANVLGGFAMYAYGWLVWPVGWLVG